MKNVIEYGHFKGSFIEVDTTMSILLALQAIESNIFEKKQFVIFRSKIALVNTLEMIRYYLFISLNIGAIILDIYSRINH